MANIKINDLVLAGAVSDSMQLETDIGGSVANRVTAAQLSTKILTTDLQFSGTLANAIQTTNVTLDGLDESTTTLTEPAANQFQINRGTSSLLVQTSSTLDQDLSTTSDVTFNSVDIAVGQEYQVNGVNVISYTNATPMPDDVGGYETGTTFTDQDLTQMFDGLLYPYQYPAFSSFSISGQASPIEVGTEITGIETFIWGTTNPTNIQSNSINIYDITGSSTLFTGLINDGSEQYDFTPPIVKNSQASNQWRIEGTNTKLQTFTRNYTVNWQWRIYWGTSPNTSLTESEIEALADDRLDTNVPGNYSFAAGDYKYFAWPSLFNQPASFKDQATSLDVPMESPDIVSVTNVNGITTNYSVYRTTNIIGSSITIVVAT
jgi:hypothetical protein